VCVGRRNQKNATLSRGLNKEIDVHYNLFGAGDIEAPTRKHEIRLHIHFPEDRFR
jgi:hypothetical protein